MEGDSPVRDKIRKVGNTVRCCLGICSFFEDQFHDYGIVVAPGLFGGSVFYSFEMFAVSHEVDAQQPFQTVERMTVALTAIPKAVF